MVKNYVPKISGKWRLRIKQCKTVKVHVEDLLHARHEMKSGKEGNVDSTLWPHPLPTSPTP